MLQKLSDAPLSTCPACGADTFSKQVTAAGFQLKGSGWYVTDFRGGSGGTSAAASGTAAAAASAPAAAGESSGESSSSGSGGESASASSTPCGGSCACH